MANNVNEARSRLSNASHSFNALMTLLSTSSELLQPEDLFCLIQPIQGEVDAALDELVVVK